MTICEIFKNLFPYCDFFKISEFEIEFTKFISVKQEYTAKSLLLKKDVKLTEPKFL